MSSQLTVGVDIGGTKLLAALVDGEGTATCTAVAPTPATAGPEAVLDEVARLVASLPGGPHHEVVGVGSAGQVDSSSGRVLAATAAIRDWAGVDLAGGLSHRLGGLRVCALNDVQAFALAELTHGAGSGARDLLALNIGTGIGGAVVHAGRLVVGAHHAAGHVGHVPCPEAVGARCTCGVVGHVEAVASGPALLGLYRAAGGRARDLAEVAQAAGRGERMAAETLAAGATALGRVVAGLVSAFDPEVVVVGGGVAQVGEAYLRPLREAVAANTLSSLAGIPVRVGALGQASVAIGAATWARRDEAT